MNLGARAAAAVWLVLLLLAAGLAARLSVSGDLRLFMPVAQTDDQRLLLDSLGEGPGARLLLLALHGDDADTLAELSTALRAALEDAPEFAAVLNGEEDGPPIDAALLPYRYLLSPGLDAAPLDAAGLRAALQSRLRDLASPAGALVEPWVGRDPTLEMLRLAEAWQPPGEPERLHGVWFSGDHAQALLVAETRAAGFDPQGQRAAVDALRAAFAGLEGSADARLEISGPGAFSVLMGERTRAEASRLGIAGSLGIVALLVLAYRGLRLPLLGALPLLSAVLGGAAAVSLAFGSVHGITLAFGITLVGIALDYPVHLFSHLRPGLPAPRAMAALWPTLLTGVASTCLAYLGFFAAGVTGLAQLAVFAIAGLLTAAACTRWLLPVLLPPATRDLADAASARMAAGLLAALRPLRWAALALAALAAAWLLLSPRPLWDDNLAGLTPVPAELLARDAALRGELGAADVRYLLVIEGEDSQALLQRAEALAPALEALVASGAAAEAESPARYLPSHATQRARQARLPDATTLASSLDAASEGLPFREGVFAAFLADVTIARAATPLSPEDLRDTPVGARLASLLPDTGAARPVALVALAGVQDPGALADFAAAQGEDLHLLDLKQAAESLAAAYRERVLRALGIAVLVLVAVAWLALRRPARMLRVLAPVLLGGLLLMALLHALGIALNLFHLVALVLAAGLGLDYALFFERAGRDAREQRRTLHAIGLCLLSTGLVFGLLATAGIPVLRAIGLTVALGIVINFLLAAMMAGEPAHASANEPANESVPR